MNHALYRISLASFFGIYSAACAFQTISFDGKSARWEQTEIEYVVDSRGSDNFEDGCDGEGRCTSERTAIRRAFNSWSNVDGVNISFSERSSKEVGDTAYDGVNTIKWVESNWTSQNITPPADALAVTSTTYDTSDNHILDFDVRFNGEYFQWAVIDSENERNLSGKVDIENIAAHEFGHAIGADHSSEDTFEENNDLYLATMFYASGPGETFRRDLNEDDFALARHLYPVEKYGSPGFDQMSPQNFDIRNNSVVQVEISGNNFGETTVVMIAKDNGGEDIGGKILVRDENNMTVEFDLYGLASGSYDVVLANSHNESKRVSELIQVESAFTGSEDGVGSVTRSSTRRGCASHAESSSNALEYLFFLLILPTIFNIRKRRLAYAKDA